MALPKVPQFPPRVAGPNDPPFRKTAVTIGQCACIGLSGSKMRKTLHQLTVQLWQAYLRIEELAQTDELTGSPNRRSIVKTLDDEIARGQSGTP